MADADEVKVKKTGENESSDNTEPSEKCVSGANNDTKHLKTASSDVDDLDELLDSALADFGKPSVSSATKQPPAQDGTKSKTKAKDGSKSKSKSQEAVFNEAFDEAELANAAQEAMKAFSTQDPQMFEQFQKFMSQESGGAGDSAESDDKFLESLKETMKAMSENAHDIQSDDLGDDDLAKALSDLGLDMNAAEDDQFEPIIENMMKSLLSKDVLYPSMHNMNEVYPSWLEENESKLSTEQYETYYKQHQLIKQICVEFESERQDDSEQVRKQRFDKIYNLMQEMQECGQPPPDIVKELAPGMSLDERGIPRIAGMEQQCCVM